MDTMNNMSFPFSKRDPLDTSHFLDDFTKMPLNSVHHTPLPKEDNTSTTVPKDPAPPKSKPRAIEKRASAHIDPFAGFSYVSNALMDGFQTDPQLRNDALPSTAPCTETRFKGDTAGVPGLSLTATSDLDGTIATLATHGSTSTDTSDREDPPVHFARMHRA
jgi:hypothetical protein